MCLPRRHCVAVGAEEQIENCTTQQIEEENEMLTRQEQMETQAADGGDSDSDAAEGLALVRKSQNGATIRVNTAKKRDEAVGVFR